ncbi:hypothetical protein HY573_02505 [Candidatus Parcubacteria bacterium]|nr:hypothetical protein [Candidatus Parcubacteria bacterium]
MTVFLHHVWEPTGWLGELLVKVFPNANGHIDCIVVRLHQPGGGTYAEMEFLGRRVVLSMRDDGVRLPHERGTDPLTVDAAAEVVRGIFRLRLEEYTAFL